jgi:hypothetical protein
MHEPPFTKSVKDGGGSVVDIDTVEHHFRRRHVVARNVAIQIKMHKYTVYTIKFAIDRLYSHLRSGRIQRCYTFL